MTLTRRVLFLLGAALAVAAVLLAGRRAFDARLAAQTASPSVVAIRNATILTVTRGTIASGTIVVRNGRIDAVGANVAVPSGAEVYDAAGKFVSPGIIDAHSHIASDAINESTTAVASMTSMFDVLDPTDVNIYRALAGGTTSSNILHGSSDPIGGKTLVIKLRWGKTVREDFAFAGAMPGIKFALGENVKRPGAPAGATRRYPGTRQGVEYVIRDAFTRAKRYRKAWQEYADLKTEGVDALPPRRDLQLDALVEVLDGTRLVHAHCYRADEILMLIRLAEEMGFKISTFQHVLEGYKVAKEIAAHGAGASTFSDWWGYKIEAEDAIPYNAALMVRKGVLVSINSDDAEQGRRLNMEAAKSIRYGGLSEDEALATVTINPARQLGIEKRVGSIEAGKDADLVVWNRHPLSTAAIVERTYIDGLPYYDREKDLERVAELEQEKKAALERERAAPATANAAPDTNAPAPSAANAPVVRPAAQAEPLTVGVNVNGSTWAITNARIVTVSGPVIARGTIVIKGNRIVAVGANAAVPAGARVVDAAGANVYPGFINAGVDLGLNEPGVRNYDDVSEVLPFNQMLRTRVAYQSDSDAIPVARAGGITTVAIRPGGTATTVGGEVPVMNLDGWTWEENTLRPSAGLAMTFPIAAAGRGRGAGPAGAGGAAAGDAPDRLAELNRLLDQARAYAKRGPDRQVDWSLEPFVPVLDGRKALFVSATTEQSIRDAVAWAERSGVRMVLHSGADVQRVASFLKEHDVPVILSTVLALPPRDDAFHAYTYQTPGILAKAGVPFAFSSGGFEFARNVPFQAGRAIGWGLDPDAALRALTFDAARILGIDKEVGSIEPGKLANLVVIKGEAVEVRSEIRHVIIAGRDVPLDTKHTELYKRYMARR